MEIIAYEMKYVNDSVEKSDIICIPFEAKYFQKYMRIYNECFYEMRKALDIQPYNFLNEYKLIVEKVCSIWICAYNDNKHINLNDKEEQQLWITKNW